MTRKRVSASTSREEREKRDWTNGEREKSGTAQQSEGSVTSQGKDVDSAVVYEFGGAPGVTAMMIGFPLLMYYLWLSVHLHQGKLFLPSSFSSFLSDIGTHAPPTGYAVKIYGLFSLLQALLAYVMPGPEVKGLPLPSERGRQLSYKCNGVWSFYSLLLLSLALHLSGVFPLTDIVDNFGPLMTVAILSGFLVSFLTYFLSLSLGTAHRMSGNHLYDFFMGAPLNPRIGKLDLKMWAEIRIPWVILFFISVSCALKEKEREGAFSPELLFMTLAHFLYVNACMKGEECIPTTWDIFYEKWGFMLIFWNLAGVPFTYCLSSLYLLERGPMKPSLSPSSLSFSPSLSLSSSTLWYALCFVLLLGGYYVWDTANSQKNRFRMQQRGTFIPRWTFPQLPWGTLKNPNFIRTRQGNLLLVDGWWQYARKVHYTADLCMALSWGLITGFGSFIPYFYFCFFVVVLVHRAARDMERCREKYGEDWREYCRRVPYVLIPGVY